MYKIGFIWALHLENTLDRLQSKTILTIGKRRSKIVKHSVFDCHLSPMGRQMAIKNSVSSNFLSMFVDSIVLFDCAIPGVEKDIKEVTVCELIK